MLSWEHVEQIARFDSGGTRVLSLYLDLDPPRQSSRSCRTGLEQLEKETSGTLTENQRAGFSREAARVNEWFERLDQPQGLGLILFSCTPRQLWLSHFVNVPVRDHLVFDLRPDVAGLLELVDDYERFAVALVSKDRARLFTVFAGAIEEAAMFEDVVPGQTDSRGLAPSKIQRDHDQHVLSHLKKAVAQLSTLQSRRNFDRLIVMGPVEATTELKELLPHALKARLAAVVPADEDATNEEILKQALEAERRIEADAEDRVVGEVVEMARSGARATCGVGRTLEALEARDVRTLVIAEALSLVGTECSHCGRLHHGNVSTCPSCGAVTLILSDFSHQVTGRAVDQGGRVEVVHGAAATRLVNAGQGLAAFLRFPLAADRQPSFFNQM